MERFRYRAYVLNPANGIELAIDLYCTDDETALRRAHQFVNGCDIELWQGTRLISRILHDPNVRMAPE